MELAKLRLPFSRYQKYIVYFFAIVILFISLGTRLFRDSGRANLYAYQAQAFLNGRLDIPGNIEQSGDVAFFNGHYYVVFPPVPAILLIPFVAVLGIANTRPLLIAVILTFVNMYLFVQILRKFDVHENYITWLFFAFFFGTGYWPILHGSTYVWGFAQVTATTAILLALNESFGKGRGILIGLFLGMAVLSRQDTVFYLVLIFSLLMDKKYKPYPKKTRLVNFFSMLAVMGLWAIFYLFLNWQRFGNMFDTGYAYIQSTSKFLTERAANYGLFNIVYIPFNFTYMFLQGFQIQFDPGTALTKIMGMDPFGTSLTFASPFLLIAFWAKWERNLLKAAWLSIGLILCVLLMYYNNGWVQLNTQRFTFDFIPILIILVALGMPRVHERIWKLSIAYSVLLNTLALIVVPAIIKVTH